MGNLQTMMGHLQTRDNKQEKPPDNKQEKYQQTRKQTRKTSKQEKPPNKKNQARCIFRSNAKAYKRDGG